ncbi:MAG: type II CAAX endopeptidase family protein [Candidatus Thermoplasmatota archaeon]
MDFNYKKPSHIFALIILIFTLFILVISPILTYLKMLPSTGEVEINEYIMLLSSIITVLIFLGTPFIWYISVNRIKIKEMLKRLKIKTKNIENAALWGFIATILMFTVVFLIGSIITYYGYTEEELSNIQDLARYVSMYSLLLIILIQSVGEEIFFRGFLLEKIGKLFDEKTAIIATAILFGLAHMSYAKIYTVAMTMTMGLFLGYIVYKTKNLFSSITAHLLFNLTSFLLYYFAQSFGIEALIL